MEKTPQEIAAAVLAYCETVCPEATKGFWHSISTSIKLMHHPSESHRWSLDFFDGDGSNEWLCVLCWIGEDSNTEEMNTAYSLLGLDKRDALEAAREKITTLEQQLEEAQNVKFEGMASPAWAMLGELTKFMEEALESDVPRMTNWRIRLEDGEEVTLMNIWAATSHDSPITRATELRDMLQQVLNHSNRPEMDDAQFRMFARENINHLLYGNKEGKKDE